MNIVYKKSNKLPTVNSLFISTKGMPSPLYAILSNLSCAIYDKKEQCLELPVNNLTLIVSLLQKNFDCFILNETNEILCYNDAIPSNHKWKIPPYQHQIRAINYGLNHNGWLLLDDMGLGKTKTIIDLANVLKEEGRVKKCLVICGIASLRYNWAREIEKNSDESYCILGRKVSKRGNESYATVSERIEQLKNTNTFFTITNVDTLRGEDFIKAFNKAKIDMVVFDEIHACKSPSSKSAKTLLKIKSDIKIGLTGTIITNSPEDCYVPLKWTGNTNACYSAFKSVYNIYGGFNNVEVLGHKNLPMLKELLSTCALRRVKQSVLDLPKKNYILEYVEMGAEQRELYQNVEQSVFQELDQLDHIPTIMEEITLNMRLRQITACPSLLSTVTNKSAKIDRCLQMVDDIISQNDKVVIFCSFKGAAYEIANRLSKYGAVVCTGDISDKVIDENVNRFQTDDSIKVFVGTWQRCGTGITLTAASYMIFIDTPWTNSDFQQACDRIYRIGQTKPVLIYTLITKDTYDERVQQIIERKEKMTEDITVEES